MSLRSYAVPMGAFVLAFVISAGGRMAVAQDPTNNQGQLLMTPLNGTTVEGPTPEDREFLVDQIGP